MHEERTPQTQAKQTFFFLKERSEFIIMNVNVQVARLQTAICSLGYRQECDLKSWLEQSLVMKRDIRTDMARIRPVRKSSKVVASVT